MRSWQKSDNNPQKIGILLFERFSNHCLANGVEPLRAANTLLGRDVYEWKFMSLDGAGVTSSSGLPVAVDGAFDVWRRGGRPKVRGRVGVMFGKPIPAEQIINMGTGRGLAFLRDEGNKLRNDLTARLEGQ